MSKSFKRRNLLHPDYKTKIMEELSKNTRLQALNSNIETLLDAQPENFKPKKVLAKVDISGLHEQEILEKILKDYIFFTNPTWVWQKLIAILVKIPAPFLTLAVIHKGDSRFQYDDDKLKEFFSLETSSKTSSEEYDIFSKIQKENLSILKIFLGVEKFLEEQFWSNSSNHFLKFIRGLKVSLSKLPQEQIPVQEEKTIKEEKTSKLDIVQHKMMDLSPNNPPSILQQTFTYPSELSFLQHLRPDFLETFLNLYQNARWEEASQYLYGIELQGKFTYPWFFNRFMLNILRLRCLFHLPDEVSNYKDRIRPILDFLWFQVFSLQTEINFEKVEQIIFAKIHPILYGILIELTLQYSEKCNTKAGFNIKSGLILTEESLKRQLAIVAAI